MAASQKSENAVISLASTSKAATFGQGVRTVYIVADTDCYIAFDENVPTTTTGFLIKANQHPAEFNFEDGGPQKVSGIGTSGNLYILAIR